MWAVATFVAVFIAALWDVENSGLLLKQLSFFTVASLLASGRILQTCLVLRRRVSPTNEPAHAPAPPAVQERANCRTELWQQLTAAVLETWFGLIMFQIVSYVPTEIMWHFTGFVSNEAQLTDSP